MEKHLGRDQVFLGPSCRIFVSNRRAVWSLRLAKPSKSSTLSNADSRATSNRAFVVGALRRSAVGYT
jgi:hypothetical protein